jgi:ribose 5-phosphate isomerase A
MDLRDDQKRRAALEAAKQVKSGMALGLGTGTTARHLIEVLGERVRTGALRDLRCVPTSEDTARRAAAEGLTVVDLAAQPELDLALDGADEVDPRLDLVKGRGGAMLREKRVARAARRFLVMVDASKLVSRLGVQMPLPVEVAPADVAEMVRWLAALGAHPHPRENGRPFLTDNGNAVVDAEFPGGIPEPARLAVELDEHPQVKAHGLFLGMAAEVVVAGPDGVRRLLRPRT